MKGKIVLQVWLNNFILHLHKKRRNKKLSATKMKVMGIPWQSSGSEFTLPLPEAWVWTLVGELRSCKLRGMAKK